MSFYPQIPPFRPPLKEGDIGVKSDQGKTKWWYLGNIISPIEQLMDILEYGDTKYPAEGGANWRLVPDAKNRYTSAAMRHLTAWMGGEQIDPESGKNHLAHVLSNICFLLWFEENGYNNKGNE